MIIQKENSEHKALRITAYKEVNKAKKRGDLIQKPCLLCGEEKTEAHHPDYTKPLEVIWYCRKHHRIIDSSREALEAKGKYKTTFVSNYGVTLQL